LICNIDGGLLTCLLYQGQDKFLPKWYRLIASKKRAFNMSTTTTLSSKFQILVPKALREQQRWEAGQTFVWIPKGTGVLLMPVPELKDLAGLVKGADATGYRDREDRY
jgi:bifunctional DNA-binding transcriptional regulator/antitoxin component of YhaV-PrlF toxin-antitoxin module